MGYVTEKDYSKMAEAAADDLVNNKVPLNESISRFAKLSELNHEQVHRLCEATNNSAFNKLFQGRDKTAEDRVIEFDVANPRAILGEGIKEAQAMVAEYDDDPDEDFLLSDFRSLREIEPVKQVKVAMDAADAPLPMTSREKEAARRTVQKTYDHMRHEKLASEQLYADAIYNVKSRFTRLYKDMSFDEFEKRAVALHGEPAIIPLQELRRAMRLPEVTYNIGTLQKQAGYVDDSGLEFKLLSEAISAHEKIAAYALGLDKLKGLLS